MFPTDSQLYDRRADRCGATAAAALGIARLYLEIAPSPLVLPSLLGRDPGPRPHPGGWAGARPVRGAPGSADRRVAAGAAVPGCARAGADGAGALPGRGPPLPHV